MDISCGASAGRREFLGVANAAAVNLLAAAIIGGCGGGSGCGSSVLAVGCTNICLEAWTASLWRTPVLLVPCNPSSSAVDAWLCGVFTSTIVVLFQT